MVDNLYIGFLYLYIGFFIEKNFINIFHLAGHGGRAGSRAQATHRPYQQGAGEPSHPKDCSAF